MVRNGGRILADGLAHYGARALFGVPGESYLPLLDALYQHPQLSFISCRQEGGAAYMAEAWGKLSGQPGICCVSRGPGAANAMIGVHTAYQDSSPMLLLVGQIPTIESGREAFQELDYQTVYGGVAKLVLTAAHTAQLPELLQRAWHTALAGRPGPVVLVLPEDVLQGSADAADLPPPTIPDPAPSEAAMQAVARHLKNSRRPLMLAGGACWDAECFKLLGEFSRRQQIPVAAAFRRQDCIDNQHPHYVGELGIGSNPDLAAAARDADVLIVLAARLGDMTTSGYQIFKPDDFSAQSPRRLIHIHPDANELNRVYPAAAAIAAHPLRWLQAALHLPKRAAEPPARVTALRQSYQQFTAARRPSEGRLCMQTIVEHLHAELPEDHIIANGAGNYTAWAQRPTTFRRPHSQLAPSNGSMGYSAAAPIAAKLLRPQTFVVSFTGDGCFLMNGQELATARQYRLPVLYLLVNNACYGTIRTHQQRHFPGRPVATELQNPDFPALAQAYGCFGARADTTEQFPAILAKAKAHLQSGAGSPALIELPTK